MINEAMKAVDSAEKEAFSKIAAARDTAEKLRKNSLQQCEEMGKNAEDLAKKQEEEAMKALAAERDTKCEQARADAGKKADELRAASLAKEDIAISAVLASLTER